MIRKKGLKAGVALNPATSLCMAEEILPDADMILLMSVNPGFGGQSYIHAVTDKIRRLREMCTARGFAGMDIEVDGGIDPVTVKDVVAAGANVLVAGSAVYGAADPKAVIAQLKNPL